MVENEPEIIVKRYEDTNTNEQVIDTEELELLPPEQFSDEGNTCQIYLFI